MASKKQIEANRRNAKKSTGPRTPQGKVASARNATRHGLLSRSPVLADEDAEQYEELRRRMLSEMDPQGQLELLMANRIVSLQWRLARVPAIEAQLIERMRYDLLDEDQGAASAWEGDTGAYGGALTRLSRYETSLERSLLRLIEQLHQRQRARRKVDLAAARAADARSDGYWWERAAAAWPGAPTSQPAPSRSEPPSEPQLVPGDGGNMGWPFLPPGVGVPDPSRRTAEAGRDGGPSGGPASLPNEANRTGNGVGSPLRAHLARDEFRALTPRLTRLREAARNGDAPDGQD